MPPKNPIAGASGSLDPMLAVCTAKCLPRTVVSQTVRISKLALPCSRIVLRSSYSAKLSGRKLKGCMTTANGTARVLGTAQPMTQYSLACCEHERPRPPRADHVITVSFSVQPFDFNLPCCRRKTDTKRYSRLGV